MSRPRVSVLVPGYRTEFLRACLDSAVGQTERDLEILVGDDCPHDGVRRIVDEYAARDPRVRRLELDGRGGRANMIELFGAARGPLIKYLNDDDLLDAECVERMAACLDDAPGVTLVTAHRRLIDADGTRLADSAINRRPVPRDSVLAGRSLIEEMLTRRVNLIGEPTSTMFRRRELADNRPDPMSFGGRRAAANGDVSMWVTLLLRGDAVYLAETLTSFRIHPGQRQREPEFVERGRRGWDQLCHDARATGVMPPLAPGGLVARPLADKPWWPAEARAIAREIESDCVAGRVSDLSERAAALAALVGTDPTVAAMRGMLLLHEERAREACELLEPAIRRSPWDADCHRTLGLARARLDDVDGAWRSLCRALAAAPDDAVTHAALAPFAAACEPPRPPEPPLTAALDGPIDSVDVCDGVVVHGWVLVHPSTLASPVELELALDGRALTVRPMRLPRDDVTANNPALAPFNPAPGFHVPLATGALEPGLHVIDAAVRCGALRLPLGRRRFNVLAPVGAEVAR